MKLERCPHCGGQAEFVSLAQCHGYIFCVECGIKTGDYWDNLLEYEVKKTWKEKALEDWNRRI